MADHAPTRITPRLRRFVEQTFGSDAAYVLTVVADAVPTYPLGDIQDPERMAAATVFWTHGDLGRLDEAVRLGQRDWRDLLVEADLGHGNWPERLDATLGAA